MARTGRRPGSPTTREDILDAARARFAADGYDGATIRAIAAGAGVDPALVHHYFGTKRRLFATAQELPLDPEVLVDRVLAGGADGVGARVVTTFLDVWDTPAGRTRMLGLVRSVVTDEQAMGMLRQFLLDAVLRPVARGVAPDRPELRANLVASQLVGLAVVRYAIRFEPIASAGREELVRAVAPTVQRYLTDPL